MTQPVSLTFGQRVRLASWMRLQSATVFTFDGYCAKNGEDVSEARARAAGFGHSTNPDTINTGSTLHTSAAIHARDAAEWEAATVIENGQRVLIEGDEWIVKVRPGNAGNAPRNSDPIAFVKAAA